MIFVNNNRLNPKDMKRITEEQFWILFNGWLMAGYDERNAETLVLSEHKVNWNHRD